MKDIIYLEPDDEITSVIDRLRISTAPFVVIVIPRGSSISQSIVNLKILKRSADEMGKETALVTPDRITRNLASQVGLSVYSKVNEVEKPKAKPEIEPTSKVVETAGASFRVNSYARYKAPTEEVEDSSTRAVKDETLSREDLVGEETVSRVVHVSPKPSTLQKKEPVTKESSTISRPMKSNRRKHTTLFVGFAGIGAFILIAALVLVPSASATVRLKTEDYAKETIITLDRSVKTINKNDRVAPAVLFEVENSKTKNFQATGKKNMGEKATGKITIYNSFDQKVHKFSKGTRFVAQGKSFLADTDFSVAGAQLSLVGGNIDKVPGQGEVRVTAAEAGDSFNLDVTTYIIEGQPTLINGRGEKMTGGVTKEVTVVEESDLTAAQETLQKEIVAEMKQSLIDKAWSEGSLLLDGTITDTVASVDKTKNAGDEAATFDCTVKVKLSGLGFKEKDVKTVTINAVQGAIEENQMLVNPDKSDISYMLDEKGSGNLEKVIVTTKFAGKVAAKLSKKEIAQQIRNKNLSVAQQSLAGMSNVEKVTVTSWPAAYRRTPILANRIKVEFDYTK